MKNDEEFGDLLIANEEDFREEKKRKRRESLKTITRNIAIIVAIPVVGFGVYTGVNTYNDYQRDQERLAIEAARVEITPQLVNVEQVEWADNTCSVLSSWEQEAFPLYEETVEPGVAQADMAVSLKENAEIMRDGAERISQVPARAHDNAFEQVAEVTLVDNMKIVHPENRDYPTSSASQALSASLTGYAQSMDDIANDLDSLSDYDFGGMRTMMLRVESLFESMNPELEKELSAVFTTDIFDNPATMEEIASLESCNENMISYAELEEDYGEELREQAVLRDLIAINRCQHFLDNTALISTPFEVAEKNMEVCEEFIATHIVEPTHPIRDKVILSVDNDRAVPDMEVDEELAAEMEASQNQESGSESAAPESESSDELGTEPEESGTESAESDTTTTTTNSDEPQDEPTDNGEPNSG